MAAKTYIPVGGTYTPATNIYVADGGVWRTVKNAWYYDGSAWRLVHQNLQPVVPVNTMLFGFQRTSPLSTSGSWHTEADVSFTMPSNAETNTYRFTNGANSPAGYYYTTFSWTVYKNGTAISGVTVPITGTNPWCGSWFRENSSYTGPHYCSGTTWYPINVDFTAGPNDVIRIVGQAAGRTTGTPVTYTNFWGKVTRIA
jgi:hypothetical protein